jgi:uncharacterized protein (TIGR03083 family)
MTAPGEDPTIPELVDAWQDTLTGVLRLAESLTDDEWRLPTPCPGWSVGDVVVHCLDIEQALAGRPRPDHVIDVSLFPHIRGPVGEQTELGVDARRGDPRADVLDDLRDVIGPRRAQLDATAPDEPVPGPFGRPTTLERLVRVRTFDIWVHVQDIRSAIGRDGDWDTPGAVISLQQITRAVPFAWSRNVEAPAGATVRVQVTGPGLFADTSADVDEDGQGRTISTVTEPTVGLVASWPDVMRLACGRIATDDPGLRARITLTGDAALGEALLPGLTITP